MIPLFTRRTVLVDANTGGIDHDDLALEGGGNRRKQAVPHSAFAPADELKRPGFPGGIFN
jgi:hypothetical protein